jgi:hypothetical protein
MKTIIGYIVGAAITLLLAGSPVQANAIYYDADFLEIMLILTIGPVLAVIAGFRSKIKT